MQLRAIAVNYMLIPEKVKRLCFFVHKDKNNPLKCVNRWKNLNNYSFLLPVAQSLRKLT